jgi:alkylation response protein AidB-like acyl-CoA dehydrogenase
MDFELSDDQLALQAAARDLLDRHASPSRVRSVVDAGGGLDHELWSAMLDQGWAALSVGEDLGGLGLGLVEAAVLAEQVGAHCAPAPILQQLIAIECVARALAADPDRGELLRPLLERLVSGVSIATVASTPVAARATGAGGEVDHHRPGGWTLTGSTEPALFAPSASVAIVRAYDATDPSGDGVLVGDDALFVVDLDDDVAGGRPRAEPAMDRTREVGWLRFEQAPALWLGGADAVEDFVDVGATLLSAELLGASARAMELAVEYAKVREQFGRPIGSFQAVKHRCADMLVDVEGMRSAAYYAAWCLSARDPDRSMAASTAKTWCSDASKRVMASALQVHGGIGFTWECDVHLFLKRAQLDQQSFGDAVVHRARLAKRLRAKVEAGDSVI